MRIRTFLFAAALATTGSCSACIHNRDDPFPVELGFTPLEPLDPTVVPPSPAGGDPYPQTIGPIVSGARGGHEWAHAVGFLKYSIEEVYAALADPNASEIHVPSGGNCGTSPGTEPFPVSFTIHYSSPSGVIGIGDVHWDVAYRAGVSLGSEQTPQEIGLRYQKVWGVSQIGTMTGSLKAYPAPGQANVTQVELEEWLDAPGCGTASGTLVDLFGDLAAVLDGSAPAQTCRLHASSC
ncbi:MAG TPA: hypothetical protein VLU43_14080 [Anaeromyxobacteraceae bacterium]|nr:hypothetical protein [Anaeromyxobacteraceae bacterium]